jgi:hypothetical protein
MSRNELKPTNVFLTLDRLLINGYFNKHDPSPIYKRQLNQHFEEYILESVKPAKRYDAVFYKLNCKSEDDKKYAEPLMYAIRRHFSAKKLEKELEFIKFKRRNSILLIVSTVIVILFQGLLPLILNAEQGVHTGLINSLDIFAWVLLWHPIDELVFSWNKHLKQICLLNKLATSESLIIENEKSLMVDRSVRVVA